MTMYAGRKLLIKKNNVTIAAVKSKTLAINNEVIDTTNDDNNGWRSVLDEPGVRSVDLSVSGVEDDDILRNAAFGANPKLTDITLEWPDGATLSCDFFISNYENGGENSDGMSFSCSLASSGEPTYTAAV